MLRYIPGLMAFLISSASYSADLLEIFEKSQRYDARYQISVEIHGAAQELHPQARAALLPFLSLDLSHTETAQNIKSSDNQVFARGDTDFPTDDYSLTLTQPLLQFEAWAGLKQAKATVRQAAAEFAAAKQDLILRCAELYLGVLAAQDNLEFAEAESAAIERQLKLASARRRTGLATRVDVHDAEARFAAAQAQAVAAANRLDDARQALRESIAEPAPSLVPLETTIPLAAPQPSNAEAWESKAQVDNYLVKARLEAVEAATQLVRGRKTSRLPTLDLSVRYNNQDTQGTLFGGGSDVDTVDYALRFRVPLYTGGRASSQVRDAKHQLARTQQELRLQRLVVLRESRAAYFGVLGGISRVEALANSVKAQESALEAKQRGYGAGISTALDVLDAERDLYLSKRDYAQSRYDYLLSTLRLKQATGVLQESDLVKINSLLGE